MLAAIDRMERPLNNGKLIYSNLNAIDIRIVSCLNLFLFIFQFSPFRYVLVVVTAIERSIDYAQLQSPQHNESHNIAQSPESQPNSIQ